MTSSAAVSAQSPDDVPVYYLVPVRTGNDVTLAVWYYQALTPSQWTRVAAKELNSNNQSQVILQQASAGQIIDCTNLRAEDLDLTVQLYVAVARNLYGDDPHPNSYTAVDGAVTIDVSTGADMTRALILVFTKNGSLSSAQVGNIDQLMSTTEPEIKNGVGADQRPRA